jgi:benzodiazapine receptor
MNHRYISLALFLALVVAASFLGSGNDAGQWYYVTLNRPSFAPPAWLYAAGWAVVYVLMAFAAWKVWLTGHLSRRGVLTWWLLLLVLTVAWPMLFFGWNRTGWALPLIGIAAALSIYCIRAFRSLSREAGSLMMPFLVWTAYLFVFNLMAWVMNGGIAGRFLQG